MIKREHLRQAIVAIARYDQAAGHALEEMLAQGAIAGRQDRMEEDAGDYFHFIFQDRPAAVSKFVFLTEGPAALEQALLIRYGRLLKSQELTARIGPVDFPRAAREAHRAGLEYLVDFELKRASEGLASPPPGNGPPLPGPLETPQEFFDRDPAGFLHRLKMDRQDLGECLERWPALELYRGLTVDDRPVVFGRFPFCRRALVDLAGAELEFFHPRLVLELLRRGEGEWLFCGSAEGVPAGLVLVWPRKMGLTTVLEIKYLATSRGRPGSSDGPARKPPPRGIGTFVLAGVWLHWRRGHLPGREMVLDSETGARGFYETVGFAPRGMSCYALKRPRGPMLPALISLADGPADLEPKVVKELAGLLRKTARRLGRKARSPEAVKSRQSHLQALERALASRHAPLARAAGEVLAKAARSDPEAARLLDGPGPGKAG